MPAPKNPTKREEWRRKIGLASRGLKRIVTAEHRKNLSLANKGNTPWIKGKRQSPEHVRRRQETRIRNGTTQKLTAPRGPKHYLWIEDRSKIKGYWNERNNPEYKQWRNGVMKRDKRKCRMSNDDCEGKLTAHHILSWSKFPNLRYDIKNGITLCHYHHPRTREKELLLAPLLQEMVI